MDSDYDCEDSDGTHDTSWVDEKGCYHAADGTPDEDFARWSYNER